MKATPGTPGEGRGRTSGGCGAGEAEVVLVTGGAGGLGTALVAAFREAGWRVAAAGHRTPPRDLAGPDVLPLAFDVRRVCEVEEAVEQVLMRWGRIDGLINNAGLCRDARLPRLTEDDFTTVLETHLKGAFLCSRAVLPGMIQRQSGHILNVGSWAARSGPLGQSAYAAAKAAMAGLTVALAREVGGSGVRVNAVLPGVMRTGMTRDLPESALAEFAAANVLGRLNRTDAVARQIVFLAGQEDVSGQVFQWDSRIGRWD